MRRHVSFWGPLVIVGLGATLMGCEDSFETVYPDNRIRPGAPGATFQLPCTYGYPGLSHYGSVTVGFIGRPLPNVQVGFSIQPIDDGRGIGNTRITYGVDGLRRTLNEYLAEEARLGVPPRTASQPFSMGCRVPLPTALARYPGEPDMIDVTIWLAPGNRYRVRAEHQFRRLDPTGTSYPTAFVWLPEQERPLP